MNTIGGRKWNAGCISSNRLPSQSKGSISYRLSTWAQFSAFGFSSDSEYSSIDGINYELFTMQRHSETFQIDIWESGKNRNRPFNAELADVIHIQKEENGVIKYYRNEKEIYKSNFPVTKELFIATSINTGELDPLTIKGSWMVDLE